MVNSMLPPVFCSSNTKTCQKNTYIQTHIKKKRKQQLSWGHGRTLTVSALNAAHRPIFFFKSFGLKCCCKYDFYAQENLIRYLPLCKIYICIWMDDTKQPRHHSWPHLIVPAAEPRAGQVETQLRADGPVASQVLAVNEDHAFTPALSTEAAMSQRTIIPNANHKSRFKQMSIIHPDIKITTSVRFSVKNNYPRF